MSESSQYGKSIANQAVQGSVYSVGASLVTLVIGFARSVLLARLLLPEHFGLVALALFWIELAAHLRDLGLDAAIIHRQDDRDVVLSTYFLLRVGTATLSSAILLAATPLVQRVYPAMVGLNAALPILIGAHFLGSLSHIQETLLRKDLAFSAIAATNVVASATMTIVAPWLAWRGWGIWALVAEQFCGVGVRLLLTWGPFRHWRPCLAWDGKVARWFWRYGRSTWAAASLAYVADQFDDFWVGTALGGAALGHYARAYELAHYPRRVLANPLASVLGPVFARVQHDRLQLSQLFYRSAHLVLRTSFLIGGVCALVIPEFIHFVIGDKWLPVLWTFRLMLAYTTLDSVLMLAEHLLLATGRPQDLQRARLAQITFFLPAVVLGARLWGINGVALAADGMLLVGAWWLYRAARGVVDFSLARLVGWPTASLLASFAAGLWLEQRSPALQWGLLAQKLGIYLLLSLGTLLIAERKDCLRGAHWLWQAMREQRVGV